MMWEAVGRCWRMLGGVGWCWRVLENVGGCWRVMGGGWGVLECNGVEDAIKTASRDRALEDGEEC